MRLRRALVAAVAASALAIGVGSCAPETRTSEPKPRPSEQTAKPARPPAGDGNRVVLMMGRSVMAGWFAHWTDGSGEQTVGRKGFVLRQVEIDTPPEIANSVERHLGASQAKGTVVFFKFCFDDFAGSSKEEASTSLSEKKRYVESVYRGVVAKRDLKLIVGNALPRVKVYTDPWLVWHHRLFNSWLREFAERDAAKVYVFDQYRVLADEKGNLRAEYALGREDSHLNDRAYSALDGPFDELLGRL